MLLSCSSDLSRYGMLWWYHHTGLYCSRSMGWTRRNFSPLWLEKFLSAFKNNFNFKQMTVSLPGMYSVFLTPVLLRPRRSRDLEYFMLARSLNQKQREKLLTVMSTDG